MTWRQGFAGPDRLRAEIRTEAHASLQGQPGGVWLRPLGTADRAAFSALMAEATPPPAPADSNAIPAATTTPCYFCIPHHGNLRQGLMLVAEDQPDHLVGMVHVAFRGGESAVVRRLRIVPAWHTSWLDARLLQAAMLHCDTAGRLKVRIEERLDRPWVRASLERLGWHCAEGWCGDRIARYADLYFHPGSPQRTHGGGIG